MAQTRYKYLLECPSSEITCLRYICSHFKFEILYHKKNSPFFFFLGPCGTRTSIKPCPKKCSSKERPVCGSDKKTYKNGCFLALAKCGLPKKDRGSLRLEYNGPCGAPATPKPCPRWEDCKIIDKPVCGTDGKTYPNVCRLRVAMCHARRNKHKPIKLRHRSACKTRKGKKEKGKKGKKNKKERSNRKGRKDRKE